MDFLYALEDDANQKILQGWSWVVSQTGGDDGDFFRICALPALVSVGLFWILNVPLLFFNFVPSMNPLERWKVQKGRYEKKERVIRMILVVLMNQAISMAISINKWNYDGLKDLGIKSGLEGLPGIRRLAWQIPACCFLYDVLFFFVHCAMHTKWLYHNIHKWHHMSKISIGISSAYFHPVDYVLSGLTVLAPPLIVGDHILTNVIWLAVHMLETTNAHCGYDIPFTPSARDHGTSTARVV